MFGMVDCSSSTAKGYMELVPDRTAATLLPLIQQHVLPGITVHSDEWRAYSRVRQLPNVNAHGTVNHSINSVDPEFDDGPGGACWKNFNEYFLQYP